jgi:hypothetical protein
MWYNKPHKNSSKEKVILYLALIIISISFIYVLLTPKNENYIEEYKHKINILKTKVDSINKINKNLANKVNILDIQILELDKSIIIQDKKITILKKQTNEKINYVDSFSSDELIEFFTERYGQHLDSIAKTNSKVSN